MMKTPRKPTQRRATTILELMIAVAIMALVIGILIPATIYYGRTLKGIRMEQRMQQATNQFIQRLSYELTRADTVEFVSSELVRIKARENELVEDPSNPGYLTYKPRLITIDLEFTAGPSEDPDNIEDNRLIMLRTVEEMDGTLVERRIDAALFWVSPMRDASGNELPIFTRHEAHKTYSEMIIRMGDRTNPPSPEDDRLTGAGYQSFPIRTVITPIN